jgi:hypothetical protein
MKNLLLLSHGRNGARHWLSLRESLIVASAIASATAQPAHAETLTMICGGYSVAFSPGNLTSHAPNKDRDYPITKVDRQNSRTVVSGKTRYGKITAFFSKDGHSSIVWTNGKDIVLNQCASETVLATQPPLQESRSEADAEATAQRDEAAAKRAESAASKAAARLEEANRSEDGDAMLRNRPTEADTTIRFFATDPSQLALNQPELREIQPKQAAALPPRQAERESSRQPDAHENDNSRWSEGPIPMPKAPKQEEKNTDQLLFSWSSAGDMTTRPFIVEGPWEIQWNANDDIYIRVFHADGSHVSSNQGKGVLISRQADHTTFRFHVLPVMAIGPSK